MYYLYFSDTWFFDTNDQYMYTYSEILALCLLSLDTSRPGFPAHKPDVFQWLTNQVTGLAKQVKERLQEEDYIDEDEKINFTTAGEKAQQRMYAQYPEFDPQSYAFKTAWWTEIFKMLATPENESLFLERQSKLLRQELLVFMVGSAVAKEHGYSIIDYVTGQLERLVSWKLAAS